MKLIKPHKLNRGDKVATVSLSWGGAGELPQRYLRAKEQLETVFGLEVVEMPHTLKSADYLYYHPQSRAEDLMRAFEDPSIKAIISTIGGEDSMRILKYVDIEIIRKNPKIFLGFSDTTITHFQCLKAGLTSFYGTSALIGFAENGGMHDFQIKDIQKTLFSSTYVGEIKASPEGWTTEYLDWFTPSLQNTKRMMNTDNGYCFLRGESIVRGHLVGGCMEVLEMLKGTQYWPTLEQWRGAILFLETSENMPEPTYFRYWLRNYALQGILHQINGIILGRPYDNRYVDEYEVELLKVLDEEGLYDIPVVTRMNFGHTCPTFTIPFGCQGEIDCLNKRFSILEAGVI